MHAVLPPPEAEMNATAQEVGLKASLAIECEDRTFGHRAFERPELFDDADAVIRDEPERQPGGDDRRDQNKNRRSKQESGKHGSLPSDTPPGARRGFPSLALRASVNGGFFVRAADEMP